MEDARHITTERLAIWQRYHEMFASLEAMGLLRRPIVPEGCEHNGHMYYIVLAPGIDRGTILDTLNRNGIGAVFHYVPLHSSPAGRYYGRAHGNLAITTSVSQRLIRLPLWVGLAQAQQERVFEVLKEALSMTRLVR
jgi:dTDP-4-amino-4,6-dideoxygalactose transaminase